MNVRASPNQDGAGLQKGFHAIGTPKHGGGSAPLTWAALISDCLLAKIPERSFDLLGKCTFQNATSGA